MQAAASATNAPFPTSLPSTESLVTRPFEKAPPASSAVAQPSTPAVETPSGELDSKQLFNRLFEASGPGANVPATPPVAPVGRLVVPMPADRAPVAAPEAPGAQAAVVAALPAPQSRELLGSGEPDGGAPARSGSAALVRFPEGSADLPAEARDTLRLVASLHHEKGGTIRVVGHASGRTSELSPERHKMAKFDVSLRRARVVADALIGLGVKPEAVSISAMSDNDPVYYESMPSGEAGNRRAEIFLEY
ncbi:MAG: OmpA family protein [Alphaproteobacteria bacterium]